MGAQCCDSFALTVMLLLPCLCGSRPGSPLTGMVGVGTPSPDVNGKSKEREDLAVTLPRERCELAVVRKVIVCVTGSALCL